MNCREFDRSWNEVLDLEADLRRKSGPAQGEQAASALANREADLRDHLAICHACRPVQARYERLRQALRAGRPAPTPPADLAERILAPARLGTGRTQPRYRNWHGTALLGTAAAAALLLACFLVLRSSKPVTPAPVGIQRADSLAETARRGTSPGGGEIGARSLSEAVTDATEATWDLARTTSEPAARLSRQVLDAALLSKPGAGAGTLTAESFDNGGVSFSSVLRAGLESSPAPALLREVGERVAAGVRPLSTTARQAFGFLRSPTFEKPGGRNTPPAAKGA